jgi:hypothetical protein
VQTIRQHARSIGAKSVQSVHGAYKPLNDVNANLKKPNYSQLRGALMRNCAHLTSEARDG